MDKLVCSICQEMFVSPGIIDCGHTFCTNCITNWKEKSKKETCPICRGHFKRIIPDYLTLSLIDLLQVKCNNPNCTWKGAPSRVEAHSKKCAFKENNIPKWMEEHIKKYYNQPKRKSNAPLPPAKKLIITKKE